MPLNHSVGWMLWTHFAVRKQTQKSKYLPGERVGAWVSWLHGTDSARCLPHQPSPGPYLMRCISLVRGQLFPRVVLWIQCLILFPDRT